MTVDEWLTAFEESAFDDVMIKVYPTSSALFINANANKCKEYLKELEEYVRNSLVQYMLPQEFITFAWFPLSQNGKVDRKRYVKLWEIESVQWSKYRLCWSRKGNCRTLERNVKCGGYRKK